MNRPVVSAAEHDDIFCRVGASFGARFDVVEVEEAMIVAARYRAAVVVAEQHLAA
jgi:hypothetical protein